MKYIKKYQSPPHGLYKAETKSYDINSPEYRAAYNSGHLTRYNPKTDTYNATPIEGPTITAKAQPGVLQEWGKYAAQHADASSPGAAMISTITSAAQLPQLLATKFISGKVQTPSEAIGIKNKWGAMATDAVLDPVNLLGAGLGGKALGMFDRATLKKAPTIAFNLPNVKNGLVEIINAPSKVISKAASNIKNSILSSQRQRYYNKYIAEADPWKKANYSGYIFGIDDIKNGRPILDTFPITKKQIAKVTGKQDSEMSSALNFVDNYFYKPDEFNMRPEIYEKIQKVLPSHSDFTRTNMGRYAWNNPLNYINNQLLSITKKDLLNHPSLSKNNIDYINENVGNLAGFNDGTNSYTFRNMGKYFHDPKKLGHTVVHEAGHSAERFGTIYPSGIENRWSDQISWLDNSKHSYRSANPYTNLGKQFGDAMVEPLKNTEGKYNWAASPSEVYAETLATKKKIYDELISKGMDSEEALSELRNPNDVVLSYIADEISPRGFFKPSTTEQTKKMLINSLPALSGLSIGGLTFRDK